MNDLSGSIAPSVGRERCPTCNAHRQAEAVCHRCKTDLSLLVDLEARVDSLRGHARRCYARGWYRRAAELSREVLAMEKSLGDLALLACACLMCGDFPAAVNAYRGSVPSSETSMNRATRDK